MLDLSLQNNVFITDTMSAFLQEIDILFNTTNTEMLGYTEFGTNFEVYLWNLMPGNNELKEYVNNKLNETYYKKFFNVDVNVEILEGTERDIYCVQIIVHSNNDTKTKTYIYK